MSAENSNDENSLINEVARSESALEDLERELHSVETELAEVAQQNHTYDLLSQICQSLEELDNLGAVELFWEKHNAPAEQSTRLRYAQRNIDDYSDRIQRIEARRMAIADKIGNQNHELDCLHYDLQEVIEREENRKNEWLVERDADDVPNRAQVMPWARGGEEDQRFRRSLTTSVATSFAVALLLSVIALPIIDKATKPQLPERMASLVRKERAPAPPPQPVIEPDLPEEIPEPEKELVDELVPDASNQPVVAETEQPDTREQVKSRGILAFRDSFASRADARPTAQLGSQARFSNAGENAVGRTQRNMVSTSAPGSSGGINLASISRDVGGGGGSMDGVAITRVGSTIGGGDGPNRPLASGASAGRTDEEIQIVFDRYKAALYRLYNRELRNDPTLRGQLVLRLTIEPDGSVSFCELQSSDMKAPALADQIVNRIRTFDFGAKEDIVAVTIIYPIDFLPAA
ncbi:MAG: AgmX/PglI C-terminal domain-containing protein [Woeseiaceae bacterium]